MLKEQILKNKNQNMGCIFPNADVMHNILMHLCQRYSLRPITRDMPLKITYTKYEQELISENRL